MLLTQLSIFSAAISSLVALLLLGWIIGLSAKQMCGQISFYPSFSWKDFVSLPTIDTAVMLFLSILATYFWSSFSAYRFLGVSYHFLCSIGYPLLLFGGCFTMDLDRR